jgi:uncharacterized protein
LVFEAEFRIGVGYRPELSAWIDSRPSGVSCLEITAEHFFGGGEDRLRDLSSKFALSVHGLSLSLGTPGPIDAGRLAGFCRVVAAANPDWISEHVAFTRTAEVDLGHLNPLMPTRAVLDRVADHARELSDRCGKPVLLENITSHVRLAGELSETDFLNALCERAGCGLLLDVTNLFVNGRNHGFDPLEWLGEIEPKRIVQLHIVGYSRVGRRLADGHSTPIQAELVALAQAVVDRSPVEAIILERDEDFPGPAAMAVEIGKLEGLRGGR